jgi:short-subunit dehydrogenase involved in D-alanine esterification of teichoic acids
MPRFTNKSALITGGTNGMGFSTAQQFIKEGGVAIITGRSEETVNKALEKLGKMLSDCFRCRKYE